MDIKDDPNVEEIIKELGKEFGKEFNWMPVSTDKNFRYVEELERESGKDDTFPCGEISAVAVCTSSDDVLFVNNEGVYRIYHLTYSPDNIGGFPEYKEFDGLRSVAEHIREKYTTEYL